MVIAGSLSGSLSLHVDNFRCKCLSQGGNVDKSRLFAATCSRSAGLYWLEFKKRHVPGNTSYAIVILYT